MARVERVPLEVNGKHRFLHRAIDESRPEASRKVSAQPMLDLNEEAAVGGSVACLGSRHHGPHFGTCEHLIHSVMT